MPKIAYFDCPTGISGDMCLGAVIHAGVPVAYLVEHLQKLGISDEYHLWAERVHQNGQEATKARVELLTPAGTMTDPGLSVLPHPNSGLGNSAGSGKSEVRQPELEELDLSGNWGERSVQQGFLPNSRMALLGLEELEAEQEAEQGAEQEAEQGAEQGAPAINPFDRLTSLEPSQVDDRPPVPDPSADPSPDPSADPSPDLSPHPGSLSVSSTAPVSILNQESESFTAESVEASVAFHPQNYLHSHPHSNPHSHPHEHTHYSSAHSSAHSSAPQAQLVPVRTLRDIQTLIRSADLPKRVEQWSLAIFHTLAEAEAAVHGVTPETVHFHEVGATDAIVDIVGTCLGLDWLGIKQLYCSPLPTGGGMVNTAHGRLPVPVPAVLKLWEMGQVPVYSNDIDQELVTPTGAAIVVTLAQQFGPPPKMTVRAVGLGAGDRTLPLANILRLWIGTQGKGKKKKGKKNG